jgi:hypothetical protein
MAGSGSLSFSLEKLRIADLRGKSSLYLVLAIVIGLTVEAVLVAIPRDDAIEQRGFITATGQAFVFVLVETVVIVVIGALTIPAYFAGARTVEVDDAGIRLEYKGRKAQELRWHDVRTRFTLIDDSGNPRMVSQSRGYHLYVPYIPGSWTFNRRSLLTRDAFETILAKANEKSARVSAFRGRAYWYGHSPQIHRIRGIDPGRE